MEERTLLAVSASVTGSTVKFTESLPGESLFLQTDPQGFLQFHDETSTTYSANLGGSRLNLTTQDTIINVAIDGALTL